MQTATQFNVSDKLTLANTEVDTDSVSTEYKCNVAVQLAGDSIWDCEITDVVITSINIHETFWEDTSTVHIGVVYTVNGDTDVEGSWRLYTDTGFEEAVSALLGCDVSYTEQGMQENNYASMEL
jgi:hypothetical protein